jgi:hypothetical protein
MITASPLFQPAESLLGGSVSILPQHSSQVR